MYDFTLCAYPHIRSEETDAGGDDALHMIFFQITCGIFPDKMGCEIRRKSLSIVGMAA